jgi:hypothetical protein
LTNLENEPGNPQRTSDLQRRGTHSSVPFAKIALLAAILPPTIREPQVRPQHGIDVGGVLQSSGECLPNGAAVLVTKPGEGRISIKRKAGTDETVPDSLP